MTRVRAQHGGLHGSLASLPSIAARTAWEGSWRPRLGVSTLPGGSAPGTGVPSLAHEPRPPLISRSSGPLRSSRNDDLLLPYPRARTRSARDCARELAGRGDHESWPPPAATVGAGGPAVRTFVSHFAGRAVSGHLTRVAVPLRTFSVLEPGGPGGCEARHRATVEETARVAGCRVAQNGGFFRMITGECLGNVVSDGRRVSRSRGLQNAQFGIRRDGTLVTG